MFFFPDPPPVFPTLKQGYSSHMRPTTSSRVATSVSGAETRSPSQVFPLWEFEVPFEVLRDETQNSIPDLYFANLREFQQLCALFLEVNGQYGRFYYTCPEDHSRFTQFIATADGVKFSFPIVRAWGPGADLTTLEQVGGINDALTWNVYMDAVVDTSAWSISSDKRSFVRVSPPADGVVVSADFSFFYLCRFTEDVSDFEQFLHHIWTNKAVKFRSVKQ